MKQHTQPDQKNEHGFTLIELLLYVAISAILMTALVSLLIMLMTVRVRNQAISEVEGQGALLMEELGQTIRSSQAITAPTPATAASTLVLQETYSAQDPTTYALSNGTVTDTEGKAPAVALTSPAVSVSGLTFTNVSSAGTTSQAIRVSYTITYVNKVGRAEYDYSKTFYNTFSLR